jgi:hypothetical protein
MTGVDADATSLVSLDEVFRHSSKLCKAWLAMPDVVDYALQCACMLFENRIDNVPQVLNKGVAAFVCRRRFGIVLTTPCATTAHIDLVC